MAFSTLAGLTEDAAVFAVDAERRIVFWSEAAERLLGFRREQVIGQHCLTANRCLECVRGCGIAEHGRVNGAALSLFRADGGSLRVRKYAQGFTGPDGSFLGGVEILVPEPEAAQPVPNPGAMLHNDKLVDFHGLLSRDPTMRQQFEVIRRVAETDSTVLVRGESGSGKELVARAIHTLSHRQEGPFLAVNCAALTPSLLESELFGHVRGAFTGAMKDHQGVFQRADAGTLFLDEVAELPLDLQAKLLRVLQERSFVPVGGQQAISVDVRIVSATHRALREEVKAGRFREDLMFRLRVVPLFLPALRERRGDISVLLWHFIHKHNALGLRRIERVAPEAMRVLLDYPWPGNVRELQNVVEYAFAVGQGAELRLSELPPEFREQAKSSAPMTRNPNGNRRSRAGRIPEEELRMRIEEALRANGGHIEAAAQRLGMSKATFWRKRKKLGV
jgi:transcriptional regulator with PAS, ATPase and Fis domain